MRPASFLFYTKNVIISLTKFSAISAPVTKKTHDLINTTRFFLRRSFLDISLTRIASFTAPFQLLPQIIGLIRFFSSTIETSSIRLSDLKI